MTVITSPATGTTCGRCAGGDVSWRARGGIHKPEVVHASEIWMDKRPITKVPQPRHSMWWLDVERVSVGRSQQPEVLTNLNVIRCYILFDILDDFSVSHLARYHHKGKPVSLHRGGGEVSNQLVRDKNVYHVPVQLSVFITMRVEVTVLTSTSVCRPLAFNGLVSCHVRLRV
jgi:hypothetical protein